MALGASTFSDLGGAASDLFAAQAATTNAGLKAKGLNIQAAGTRLSAQSLQLKAQGDLAESSEYDLAGNLARQNAAYTEQSTAIQQTQLDRQLTMTIGSQKAAVAASGLRESGSALDILNDSARQGALAKSVLAQQGAVTEAGYQEQAQSYDTMAAAGRATAAGEQDIATKTLGIADQTDQLAQDTIDAGKQAAQGDQIAAGFKVAAAFASLIPAPTPGG